MHEVSRNHNTCCGRGLAVTIGHFQCLVREYNEGLHNAECDKKVGFHLVDI
jgi:hypothetical protein